ncbi:unnamed protein product [Heligmosomoides polygyrus]|uniref:Uncharacterized protein n=1 Tax=Heligmosomoides polygyrus TaxID=6339 RepID=A0A183F5V8_HELPZ|nr:unnamed protein product [Heligmosomoides polygyrus]
MIFNLTYHLNHIVASVMLTKSPVYSVLHLTPLLQYLQTFECYSPTEVWISTLVSSRDEMKLAEGIASILRDFELRQLEINEVEKLEVVEGEDQEFQPEEDCARVTTPLTSEGTITSSGGQIVSEEKVWLY